MHKHIISRIILAFDWFLLTINWRTDLKIASLTLLLVYLFFNTDRFHVAVRLLSNRQIEDVKITVTSVASSFYGLVCRLVVLSYHILTSSVIYF